MSKRAILVSLIAATVFAAGSVGAAPTINGVEITKGEQGERMFVRWTEPAPVEKTAYPAARQVVFTLRGATVADASSAVTIPASSAIEAARLQDVTLSDGSTAARLTLTLREGASVEPVITESSLTLAVSGAAVASAPAAPAAPATEATGFVFTNEELSKFENGQRSYGAASAPATGAGQASGSTPRFFVPPAVTEEDNKAAGVNVDTGTVVTNAIMDQRISRLDFKDAPLQNILRLIANQTSMNILIQPELVKGNVTLSLQNVTIRDAFTAILKNNELSYVVEQGGIVRIVKREERPETETVSVTINWLEANEVKTALTPFLDPAAKGGGADAGGRIEVAKTSNTIIIRDIPENIPRLMDLVRRIDVPEKQVKMEIRLVDLTDSASRAIGFRWSTSGELTDYDGFQTRRPDATALPDGYGDPFPTAAVPRSNSSLGALPGVGAAQFQGTDLINVFDNTYLLEYQLQAEEARGNATIIANPTVVSLNNQEATVKINRKEPYLQGANSEDGSVFTVAFEEVGSEVTVLPRITNNGYVQMAIEPTQQILREFRVLGDNGPVPVVDEREIVTNVIVRDQQTVALGGLRQFESTQSETGVPYLLRAPVINWLFKSSDNRQNRTELVLFVTPHIIKDMELTNYELALYEKIDYNWDLPDYYFDQVTPRMAPGEENDPNAKY